MFFLIEPGKLLAFFAAMEHCWLLFNLLFIRTLKFFSARMLSSCSDPACTHARTYSFPGVGLWISLCWTFWDYCWPISPTCPGSSEQQNNRLVYQLLLPGFNYLHTFWECTLSKHPSINPGTLSVDWSPTRLCAIDQNLLSPALQPVLSPPHCPLIWANSILDTLS